RDHHYFVGEGLAWAHNCDIEVTEDVIRGALKDTDMETLQDVVSLPMVQRYVKKLDDGLTPPPIKVDGNVIVEGNHRYVAGRVYGK
ncbi:MAG: hypothetical protein AAFU33_12625, partial [Bacteroidota bacterium]